MNNRPPPQSLSTVLWMFRIGFIQIVFILFYSQITSAFTQQTTAKYAEWKIEDITAAQTSIRQDIFSSIIVNSGNIYFTESDYEKFKKSLKKIDAKSKQVLSIYPKCLSGSRSFMIQVEKESEEIYLLDSDRLFRIEWESQNCILIAGSSGEKRGISGGDGGSALNSTFSDPKCFQVLRDEIYITDGSSVRRIKDGIITTVAIFNNTILGVHVVDSDMFLIVSNQIIQYSLNDGSSKVIAGNSTLGKGFSGDGGLAINAQFEFVGLTRSAILKVSNLLFVIDFRRIRFINLDTGIVNTLAGNQDNTEYIDSFGNGDGGLAWNSFLGEIAPYLSYWNGDIIFSDFGLNSIRRINLESGIISFITGTVGEGRAGPFLDGFSALNVSLLNPTSISLDSNSENLLVYDATSANLVKISIKDKILYNILPKSYETFSDINPPLLEDGVSIAFNNGNITIVSSNGYLQQLDQNNLHSKSIGGPLTPSRNAITTPENIILNSPKGLYAFNRTLYIADSENHRIIKYDFRDKQFTLTAGTGYPGHSDGPALQSQLNSPTGIHVSGNEMFIADTKNHMIRKLDLESGIISTVAGSGILGFSGDFSNATLAELNSPTYVVKYGDFVYFSDTNNNRIRRIHLKSNIITTVIGTGIQGFNGDGLDALSTFISNPKGLAINNNMLYFTDSGNQRIRFFNISEGLVYTLSGTGDVGSNGISYTTFKKTLFNYPSSLGFYSNFFLVTDSNNHQVKRLSNNLGNSFIGSGIKGNSFIFENSGLNSINMNTPECAIMDPENFIVYVSDTGNNRILIFESGNVVFTIGDGGKLRNAQIFASNVAYSSKTGDLYIVESSMNRIRKVSNDGIVSTIAGNGIYGASLDGQQANISSLATPTGIYITKNDEKIIFTEIGTSKVRTIQNGLLATLAGNGLMGYDPNQVVATSAPLNYPISVQSSSKDLFISDSKNSLIRIVGLDDGLITSIKGDYSPGNLVVTSENTIYFIDSVRQNIRKLTQYCAEGYYLHENRMCLPICFGRVELLDSKICSGRGNCKNVNQCSCFPNIGYTGMECEIPICFGNMATESSVCSNSNGTCTEPNICKCNLGFTGLECQTPVCFGKVAEMACGGTGRGKCLTRDKCNCLEGYTGDECQLFECSGLDQNHPKVCSGRGKCTAPNFCSCSFGYSGDLCTSSENLYIAIGASVVSVALIICCSISLLIIIGCLWRKNKKQKRILETDGYMGERLLSLSEWTLDSPPQSSNGIHQDSSFFIPIDQLNMTDTKKTKKIGSGISSVFKTVWNGHPVAVKIYDLNNFETDEEQFIQEAKLLSTLRHPNIISFYGISTSATKRYIIMELMESSLQQVISNLQKGTETRSLKEKIHLLINIVAGVDYLHNLKPNKIVHRDLKPANILYQNGNCKLCDFGLSRTMSNNANSMITNNIGTIYYCPPEVSGIIDSETVSAIDIYSLSIIMWQLIFEISDPYNYVNSSVYEKLNLTNPVSYASLFHLHKQICENQTRPQIPFNSLETCREWLKKWGNVEEALILYELCELMKKCWAHAPDNRPSTTQILSKLNVIVNFNEKQ